MKIVMYILNQFPNNSMPKILYELMYRKRPSVKHFHVWGVKLRSDHIAHIPRNLMLKQLVDTPLVLKATNFNCLTHFIRVFESNHAIYFEDELKNESETPCIISFRNE